jgi:ABC-2 type transport system ATP-binding protein
VILARAVEATRRYGDTLGLDRIDLEVSAGELVGLLGPNGAGKTTLASLLNGIRRPSSGQVELCGGDPRRPASRRSLGVTPQETGLPHSLRVGEVVDFVARTSPTHSPGASCSSGSGSPISYAGRPAACPAGRNAEWPSPSPSC